jgi:hypothetical protein
VSYWAPASTGHETHQERLDRLWEEFEAARDRAASLYEGYKGLAEEMKRMHKAAEDAGGEYDRAAETSGTYQFRPSREPCTWHWDSEFSWPEFYIGLYRKLELDGDYLNAVMTELIEGVA